MSKSPTMFKGRRRIKEIQQAIKHAAEKTDDEFLQDYLINPPGQPTPWTSTWQHPTTSATYTLSLTRASTTSEQDLDACFSLIEATSRADYEASTRGWDPIAKRAEMRDSHLRYLIVRGDNDDDDNSCAKSSVRAFVSLMPTMEEGQAVVYCYEIHLQPELRGTGLARRLMECVECVARGIGGGGGLMEKVMLTVFTCNRRAGAFYARCGFVLDECSPAPRRLRGGVVKEPDYAILSKRVAREGKRVGVDAGESRPVKRVKVETIASVGDGESNR